MIKRHFHAIKRHHNPMPRIIIGVALVIGGLFGWLPVLGFWMLPLGIILLSVDFHFVRRYRRRFDVWWGRTALRAKLVHWWRKVKHKF